MRTLCLALALPFMLDCGDVGSEEEPQEEPEEPPEFPTCPDGDGLLSHAPVDISLLDVINPIGRTVGGTSHVLPTLHMYLNVPFDRVNDVNIPRVRNEPVLAPGDMIITAVRWEMRDDIDENGQVVGVHDDYTIYARACDDVRMYFHHLSSVSDELLRATGSLNTQEGGECKYDEDGAVRECAARISVPVSGGEKIATAFRPGFVAFDWGMIDERTEVDFLNPARYESSAAPGPNAYSPALRLELATPMKHGRCPLDFYEDEEVARQLEELLGASPTVKSVADPPCGKLSYDLAGTARGNWFVGADASASDHGRTLALVDDSVDPSMPVFSHGAELASLPDRNYNFEVADSGLVNRRFEHVTPGATYCWEGLVRAGVHPHHGRVLIRLDDEDGESVLTFEYQEDEDVCGPEDSWSFGPGAWRLYR